MSANVTAQADPTMAAIREILHESAPVAEEPKHKSVKVEAKPIKTTRAQEVVRLNATKSFKEIAPAKAKEKAAGRKPFKLSFQPSRKLIALMAVLAFVVFRPHWVFLCLIVALFLALGAFVLCGSDRVWGTLIRGLRHFSVRSPEKAQRLVKRMDEFALRWDGILDKLPDGLVDGLYLPDFQSLMELEDQHDAVVDARLSRLQAEG